MQKPYGWELEKLIRKFDVSPGVRAGGGSGVVAPNGPSSILYNHSHVAYQIKGNEV